MSQLGVHHVWPGTHSFIYLWKSRTPPSTVSLRRAHTCRAKALASPTAQRALQKMQCSRTVQLAAPLRPEERPAPDCAAGWQHEKTTGRRSLAVSLHPSRLSCSVATPTTPSPRAMCVDSNTELLMGVLMGIRSKVFTSSEQAAPRGETDQCGGTQNQSNHIHPNPMPPQAIPLQPLPTQPISPHVTLPAPLQPHPHPQPLLAHRAGCDVFKRDMSGG